ncbi:hypothetical protein [Streptomyces sp. CB01881]|uniref:hypothetical protein n=1 Tax=Streptomyces sp. CB01881 TaxID=2078691 RepID=UPI000CDC00C0|nr:hypothetical protein [Streptomyces sp. CB01881]AUY53281.1 hypothetical protein C2142_35220 [Streptomyces sp. CB01881]TYC69438.1 hypothetical protein EH183_35290 [Streptomyces sp. CB01881]
MSEGYGAGPASINGNANLLLEIAGLLRAGRLDGETGTAARQPRSHIEVALKVDEFARFAVDQYDDLVVLLTALSTALKTTGSNYTQAEAAVAASLAEFVDSSRYIPPTSIGMV